MPPFSKLRARTRALAVGAGLAVAATPLALFAPPAQAAAPTDVTINLLLSNDFHGRINANTVKWAWKIEDLRANTPADGGLLVGAGDMIGASEFASAVADDQPTIDLMNEIGLDVSSVGNHEFDQGWADLRDDVIGPDASRNALWTYLGANVYAKGTQNPVLPEYYTADINGVTVGVIGAVTQETSALVSPGGITEIDFGNPIDAVNRVAAQLSDGNAANGEADVIVATFHQGAAVGVGSTYEQEIAKGGEFAQMANLNPNVNVVFNGHTHQIYAWDSPVTGGDLPTRPFLQTGSYGSNIGQVVLTYDTITDKVTSYTSANRAVPTTGNNADYIAQYPTHLTPINTTVTNALAYATSVGNTPVGSISADITTAFTGGSYVNGKWVATTRDDRASESSLGDLVANALRDGLPADMGKADIGLVNPGGLRNELRYAGDTATNPLNTDGVVTYAEANNILPFINNIWLGTLTGAQLKTVVEQQWQRDAAGNIPTRPYLQLGMSDNMNVTVDPSRPEGDRVTSITINGQRVLASKTYTVSTFSFLGTGGDNFRGFLGGTWKDTGLVDRDLWIGYLQSHPNLGPDFSRQQVEESGMPATVSPGQAVSFTLGKLNLTSLGSPENTQVKVYARTASGQIELGSFPVTNGAASVSLTVPASVPARSPLVVVASPSMTTVGKGQSASTLTATADPMTYGTAGSVAVSVDPAAATGTVDLLDGATVIGSAMISGGTATVDIPGTALMPGDHSLIVAYSGDDDTSASSTAVVVSVAKATPTMTVTVSPSKIIRNQTAAQVTVKLTAPSQTVAGKVAVTVGGRTYLKKLSGGSATVTLEIFRTIGKKTLDVEYLGNDVNNSVTKTTSFTVVKK